MKLFCLLSSRLRRKIVNTAAVIGIILFSALPTYASAQTLVFDESHYEPYSLNMKYIN